MPSFLNQLFGSRPSVPTLPITTLPGAQTGAINANQAALGGAEQLVGKANQFSIDQITQMLNSVIPGYSGLVSQVTGNIASQARGEVPRDVSDALANLDAAKSLRGGYGGSGAQGDLTARDLGLTSLDLVNQATTAAESWTQIANQVYGPSQMNVGSMFISPTQEYQASNEQNLQQFQRDWMGNQIAAMPDPTVTGLVNLASGGIAGMLGGIGRTGGITGGGLGNLSDAAYGDAAELGYVSSGAEAAGGAGGGL